MAAQELTSPPGWGGPYRGRVGGSIGAVGVGGDGCRVPRLPLVTTVASGLTVVLRRARPEESAEIGRLVALACARPLYGDLVIAVVDGRPVAAISLADGRIVADPFFRAAGAADALQEYVS